MTGTTELDRPLAAIESFIFGCARWRFVAAICAVTLVKTGISFMPNIGLQQLMAQDPFSNPFANGMDAYLYWNWLGPFVAWLIHARTVAALVAMYLLFAILFTGLFIHSAFRLHNPRNARIAIILFSVLPASSTLYRWIGMDSLTLLLMLAVLVLPRHYIAVFCTAVMLGMHHFEQGFAASIALAATLVLGRYFDAGSSVLSRYSLRFCAVLVTGVVVGKSILIGVFAHNQIMVNSGRLYWWRAHVASLLEQFYLNAPAILWSVLAVGWLVALRYSAFGRRSIPFFAGLFTLMLLLPFVEDQTRVIAIVTFPILCVWWLFDETVLQSIGNRFAALIALLWVAVPWSWIQQGTAVSSAFPKDLRLLLSVF